MSEELSKEQKIAAVIDGGKIVIIGSGKEETAAILNKLSGADLDKLIEAKPFDIPEKSKEFSEDEERELLASLLVKYPDVKYYGSTEETKSDNEIIVENRRLKQQMVDREKVIQAANLIIQECSK